MKKYFFLKLTLIAVLCLIWACMIPDMGMIVLLCCAIIFFSYAQFKLVKEKNCQDFPANVNFNITA